MEYIKTILQDSLTVNGVYTVHYFEYAKDFAYSGEHHNFWELVYADRKSLVLTSDAKEVRLEAGQLFLHKPNEFHNIRCDNQNAANSVIISFDCDCPELMGIAGTVLSCTTNDKLTIGNIINEASKAFSTPLGKPYIAVMEKRNESEFACQQLLRMYIEFLLISLIRENKNPPVIKKTESNKLLIDICKWLEENVEKPLRFCDILTRFNTSASVVKKIFHDHIGYGAMEYFTRLKIDVAKQMIRQNEFNFTEIALKLGFNTSQYFTTVFKRISGMTPTEYEFSVKSNFNKEQ